MTTTIHKLPVLALALLALACGAADGDPGYRTIAADGEPLRSAFDAETGKVRAIFLAAPS